MTSASTVRSGMERGAAWMVLLRVVDRSIGLISTVVLARLLVPEDFGLIALAGSLIAMLEVLGAVGLDMALIQRADARREHFDAAWTFNVLFGLSTAALVACLCWPAAAFFNDPRLVWVMVLLSVAHAVQGFENIGVVAFRKELAFDREFKYRVIRRVVTTFFITLPLAFTLRSYWALLIGGLIGAGISVALSYALHPYRPRVSLVGLGQLMRFSKWFLLTSIVEFLYGQVTPLIVGRALGPAAVGTMSLARDLAAMSNQEIAAPIHRAAFPGYAKLAADRHQLQSGYLKVTSVLLLAIVPGSVGLALLAEPIVLLVLGEKWVEAIPLVRILALNSLLATLLSTAHYVNLAVGMARSSSLVLSMHALITIPLMLWAITDYGLIGAVMARLVASIITAPFNLFLLRRAIPFGWDEIGRILGRPLAGVLLMSAAVLALMHQWPVPGHVASLTGYVLVLATVGAAVYIAAVLALWSIRRDPRSAEAWALERAAKVLGAAGNRFGLRPR